MGIESFLRCLKHTTLIKWPIGAARFLFFLVSNLFFPFAMPIIRHFRWVDFAFFVYPGTDQDYRKYYFSKRLNRFFPALTVAGFIRKRNAGRRGIVVGTQYTIDEMADGRFQEILRQMMGFSSLIAVKTIALAGRMPSLLIQNRISVVPLLVLGNMGNLRYY